MLKKGKAARVLYIIFCIFTIYMLPLIFNCGEIYAHIGKKQYLYALAKCAAGMSAWVCGIGGVMLIFAAAAYEFYNNKKQKDVHRDTVVWLCIFTLLPLILLDLFNVIKEEGSGFAATVLYMPLIFTGGGVWLGRLAAGRYRGVKQFYAEDKVYIIACVILCFLLCVSLVQKGLLKEMIMLSCLPLFVISVLYGRFSEFEYIQERALKAAITTIIVFIPAAWLFCQGYFDFSKIYYKQMNLSEYWDSDYFYGGRISFVRAYMVYAAFTSVLAAISVIGTICGYYLRIMRLGGDREYGKNEQKQSFTKYAVCVLAIVLISTGVKLRYYFYGQVNIYDAMQIDDTDIKMIKLELAGNYDRPHMTVRKERSYITIDKECIENIEDIFKTEKGVPVRDLPNTAKTHGYWLTAYDGNGKTVFNISSECMGEIKGRNGWYKYIIPSEYYGFKHSKANVYQNLIENSKKPDTEEKLEFIRNMDKMTGGYYHSFDMLLEEWRKDPNKEVRLAVTKRLGQVAGISNANMLVRLALDNDEDVKAEAYKALQDSNVIADLDDRYFLADKEDDEFYRFYAMNYLAFKNKYAANSKDKDNIFSYLYAKYRKAVTDMDKLSYTCAMINCGKTGYCDEAEALAARLPDTGRYAQIKTDAMDIIEDAKK